jgi:hypothetical protein
MAINHFSEKDKSAIKKIEQEYVNACLVLYLLNFFHGNFTLNSFVPIYNNEPDFLQVPKIESIDGVSCIMPFYIKMATNTWNMAQVEQVIYPASRGASWQRDYGFGIQEDGMPVAEMNITPYVSTPVTQGHIDFMFEQLEAYKKKATQKPEFMSYVHQIVKEIELMRREYDVQLGFTADQIAAHDFAIILPEIDGKGVLEFDGDYFQNVYSFFKTCIQKLLPGSGTYSVLSPAGFAHGSTVLLLDIVQTNNEIDPKQEEKAKEKVEKVKETVKEIVSASQSLVGKGDPDKKLDTFFKKTKIDPVKAAPIIEKLEKVFPSSKSRYRSVKILVPGKENIVTLKKDDHLSFVGLSAQLKEQIKIPPKTELEGFLGAVAVWDKENPCFTIKTVDKKRPTIRYTHSKENDAKVKNSIGKAVKIRVAHEVGKTYLVDWL